MLSSPTGSQASWLWEAEGGILAPEPAEPGPQALAGFATLKVKQSGCRDAIPQPQDKAEFMILRVDWLLAWFPRPKSPSCVTQRKWL